MNYFGSLIDNIKNIIYINLFIHIKLKVFIIDSIVYFFSYKILTKKVVIIYF